jgi:folate-binding protein YgfZ
MAQAVYTKLPDRAFISVSGNDRYNFLQGIVTQDIDLLKTQDLIYSCLLTPNGKFLFDFFVFEEGNTLIIDCEGGDRAESLLKRLTMFKLRSDVGLELEDDIDVFQIFNPHLSSPEFPQEIVRGPGSPHEDGEDNIFKDPRFNGFRIYRNMPFPRKQESLNNETDPRLRGEYKIVDFNIWDEYRIKHEIPDGSRDMIPEKSFLHESQVILDSGVSYTKGCYMGQELVSRMHHRGLVKKQLRCVNVESLNDDHDATQLRSISGALALALVSIQN